MLRILLSLISLIFLYSCDSSKIKATFTPDETGWLVYELGDTVHFASNTGDSAIITVDFRTDMSQTGMHYPIEAESSLKFSATGDTLKIYLLKDKSVFRKYFRINRVYRSLDLIQLADSVTIGSKKFNEVYIISEDTTGNDVKIKRVYFKKKDGILRCDMRDNRSYEMVTPEPRLNSIRITEKKQ